MATSIECADTARKAETLCVKWQTPDEETRGLARLVAQLVKTEAIKPSNLCLVAPTTEIALAASAACQAAGIDAVACVRPDELDGATKNTLFRLMIALDPKSAPALSAARALGFSDEQATRFAQTCGRMRGASLAHMVGANDAPQLKNALMHAEGSEDAAELIALIKAQLEQPTLSCSLESVPVVVLDDFPRLSRFQTFTHVFVLSCVEGLLPASSKKDRQREAYRAALGTATDTTVLSLFSMAQEENAAHLGIYSARTRMKQGRSVALVKPSTFLQEEGRNRPSTTGGQAFLRMFNLN